MTIISQVGSSWNFSSCSGLRSLPDFSLNWVAFSIAATATTALWSTAHLRAIADAHLHAIAAAHLRAIAANILCVP